VAFDYGAAREHITSTAIGRAVPCDDPEAFVAAAVALATDDEPRRAIGRAGRAALDGLDTDSVARRFAELLQALTLEEAA
jgi:glycosyltransferase involved in cell wall biosynthesis